MDESTLVGVFIAVLAFVVIAPVAMAIASAVRPARTRRSAAGRDEALFRSMFPELQPHYHPEARALRRRAPGAGEVALRRAMGGSGGIPRGLRRAELAAAISKAAGDPQRARSLGESARRHVARHHRLEEMALRYLSVFESPAPAAPEPQETRDASRRLQPA